MENLISLKKIQQTAQRLLKLDAFWRSLRKPGQYHQSYADTLHIRLEIYVNDFDRWALKILEYLASDDFRQINERVCCEAGWSPKGVRTALRVFTNDMVASSENVLPVRVDWSRHHSSRKKGLERAIKKSKTSQEFLARLDRVQARKFRRIGDLIFSDITKIIKNSRMTYIF